MKPEEQLQKTNTDCVYFLASPLTCKKGIDCEYRHNEVARLNPRDCWYWLAGNCINPTCAFRHPPFDGHATEAPSESASLRRQTSIPVNKTSIPCYFYFNGFCNKGDRCSFLHGLDGSAPTANPSKAAAATNNSPYSENKSSAGHGIGSARRETNHNPYENTLKQAVDMRVQPNDDLLKPSTRSIPQRGASPQTYLPDVEEAAIIKSDSMTPDKSFMETGCHQYTDWSFEEPMDDHLEPEDRWELSPGFDVLVDNDNRPKNLGFGDVPEYLLAINGENKNLNCHFLGYDFEEPIEYDPMYQDVEPYERETYNTNDYLDNQHILDDVGEQPSLSRGRMLDSILSQNRKLLLMKLAVDDRSMDLRDYLRKRRIVDSCSAIHSSVRLESSWLTGQRQERPRGRVMSRQLHRRLASEFGENYIKSHGVKRTLSERANMRGWPRYPKSNVLKQHYKEKKLASRDSDLSAISREPFLRKSRSSLTSSIFTGPKTLAEIKEKKTAEDNGDCFREMGNSTRTWADFQGPKPLSEILKRKKESGYWEGWQCKRPMKKWGKKWMK